MADYETLKVATDPNGIATLTLARPEKRNALSERMLTELTDAAEALGTDPDVRVVVLAAEGPAFCAGGDLDWMKSQIEASAKTRAAGARRIAGMLMALDRLPKPLIGRVHADAFGGGLGMMSVCDSVIAADTARFGLTETRLGLVPATIGPYVVARLGPKARRVFFSPRLFDAAEAMDLGLVSRVVSPGDLDAAVDQEATPYLKAAPAATARAKALARRLAGAVTEADIDASIACLVETWEHPEAQQGIAAFFDRRPAPWVD